MSGSAQVFPTDCPRCGLRPHTSASPARILDSMLQVAKLQTLLLARLCVAQLSVIQFTVAQLSVAQFFVAQFSVTQLSVAQLSVAQPSVAQKTVIVQQSKCCHFSTAKLVRKIQKSDPNWTSCHYFKHRLLQHRSQEVQDRHGTAPDLKQTKTKTKTTSNKHKKTETL